MVGVHFTLQRKGSGIKPVFWKGMGQAAAAGTPHNQPGSTACRRGTQATLPGPGKGDVSTASLNPHPINQVPIVKPTKGPQLNHLAAAQQAPSANPWGHAAFSSLAGQRELTLASGGPGPAAACLRTSHRRRVRGDCAVPCEASLTIHRQKQHFAMIQTEEEEGHPPLIL